MNVAFTVALLLAAAVITALVDRWARRRKLFGGRDTGDDTRQIDILKRGEICPWPRAD